jgi:TolA-binding protein
MNALNIGKYLLLLLIPVGVFGQAKTPEAEQRDQTVADCLQERFDHSRYIFLDKLGNPGGRESKLKEILSQCPDAPWRPEVSEYLRSAREDRAEHLFYIAKYYQDLYNSGKSKSLKMPEIRYNEIVTKYPEYSKMDNVLIVIGDVETAQGKYEEAWTNYLRVINEFPKSKYVPIAYGRLAALENEKLARPFVDEPFE